MQWASKSTLIEGAKEELEILEFQHPNGFHSIKLDLKAFISELESHDLQSKSSSVAPSPSAATQESSSRKRRKICSSVEEAGSSVVEASTQNQGVKRRCKTDAVLQRAQECLLKIQHLKTSFL